MTTVDFWCEIASTYTYLAASRIEALAAAHAVPVRWRPFTLAPIFAARGWTDSPFNLDPMKGRYMWRDLERLATDLGLPFRKPSVFPRNTIGALRVALVGVDHAWGPAFIRAALRANFGEDRDVAAPAVLDELLTDLGLDGPAIRAESIAPPYKPRLRAASEEAAALGIFGAPTCVVGTEMFWGNDRLEQALGWASHGAAEPGPYAADRLATGLLRPSSTR